MKRKYYILLGLVAFLSFSCQSFWSDDQVGQYVRFSAMVDGYSRTKTTYTGVKDKTNKELIEWDNGDPVTIFMLSREKENEGAFTWKDAPYSISHEKGNNDGAISRGTLVANGTPLVWQGIEETQTEYFHRFYSVYPAGCATQVTGNDNALQFNLPAQQDGKVSGMRFAYMAAANVASKKSWAGPVELHYYPMVTTIYVTLRNVSEDENGVIDLNTVSIKSTGNIAGSYQAVLGTRDGETGFVVANTSSLSIKEVSSAPASRTLSKGDDPAVYALFLCPQTYNTADLQLLINGKVVVASLANNQNAVGVLKPYEKYNITVELTASGVANPPKIEDLSVGGVQMLVEYLNYLYNHNNNKLEQYLAAVGINNDGNKWVNAVFNEVIKNNNSGTLSAKDWLAQIEQLDKELKTADPTQKPTESKLLELFQYLFDNVTDLTIIDNHSITANLQPQDFKIYKNLQTIDIHLANGTNSIEIEEMPNLTSIKITGNVGQLDITVKKCKKLNTIDVTALDQNSDRKITIDECSSVNIKKSNDRWTITIDGVVQ